MEFYLRRCPPSPKQRPLGTFLGQVYRKRSNAVYHYCRRLTEGMTFIVYIGTIQSLHVES